MTIFIKRRKVVPRNWSKFLQHKSDSKYPSRAGTANISFGYSVKLAKVVEVFSSKVSGKRLLGSECERLSSYMGVFFYHKERLTLSLKPTSIQRRQLTEMLTTERRIMKCGYALVGVCREDFLTQKHTKNAYLFDPECVDPKLLFSHVNDHMGRYLVQTVAPVLYPLLGRPVPTFKSSGANGEVGQASSSGCNSNDHAANSNSSSSGRGKAKGAPDDHTTTSNSNSSGRGKAKGAPAAAQNQSTSPDGTEPNGESGDEREPSGEEAGFFTVGQLLQERSSAVGREFLVSWEGYPDQARHPAAY